MRLFILALADIIRLCFSGTYGILTLILLAFFSDFGYNNVVVEVEKFGLR